MATPHNARTRHSETTETDHEEVRTPPPAGEASKPKLDLSLSQIVGGALAAMTAAAVGSRVGLAGTIIGAAVASVVAGVAGAVYTASLRHTREKVRTVFWTGTGAQTPTKVTVQTVAAEPGTVQSLPADEVATGPLAGVSVHSAARPRRPRWKNVLAVAGAAFALAAVSITGIEFLAGTAWSGGDGTTIGQVSRQQARPSEPTKAPSSPPSSPEPTPTEQATTAAPTESAEPGPTAPPPTAVTPSAGPTQSAPSAEPSASASASAPAEPSATASSSANGDAAAEPTPAPAG
ncbi:MAG: hypothetical protein JWN06_1979 [Propionibacteriaceae bacterium]|jgi:hypothetical protein|nr:hypothetical protein [Propionibacteriaceae bacterium]